MSMRARPPAMGQKFYKPAMEMHPAAWYDEAISDAKENLSARFIALNEEIFRCAMTVWGPSPPSPGQRSNKRRFPAHRDNTQHGKEDDPMVCDICKDTVFLAQKAAPATAEDLGAAQDLLDTLIAHKDGCVGMAANMIGVSKRIIVFLNEGGPSLMFNPKILKRSGPYHTEEGCLSLPGRRETKRYRSIKVEYQNEAFQTRWKTFTGFPAQIIQHEIDHCDGILI